MLGALNLQIGAQNVIFGERFISPIKKNGASGLGGKCSTTLQTKSMTKTILTLNLLTRVHEMTFFKPYTFQRY